MPRDLSKAAHQGGGGAVAPKRGFPARDDVTNRTLDCFGDYDRSPTHSSAQSNSNESYRDENNNNSNSSGLPTASFGFENHNNACAGAAPSPSSPSSANLLLTADTLTIHRRQNRDPDASPSEGSLSSGDDSDERVRGEGGALTTTRRDGRRRRRRRDLGSNSSSRDGQQGGSGGGGAMSFCCGSSSYLARGFGAIGGSLYYVADSLIISPARYMVGLTLGENGAIEGEAEDLLPGGGSPHRGIGARARGEEPSDIKRIEGQKHGKDEENEGKRRGKGREDISSVCAEPPASDLEGSVRIDRTGDVGRRMRDEPTTTTITTTTSAMAANNVNNNTAGAQGGGVNQTVDRISAALLSGKAANGNSDGNNMNSPSSGRVIVKKTVVVKKVVVGGGNKMNGKNKNTCNNNSSVRSKSSHENDSIGGDEEGEGEDRLSKNNNNNSNNSSFDHPQSGATVIVKTNGGTRRPPPRKGAGAATTSTTSKNTSVAQKDALAPSSPDCDQAQERVSKEEERAEDVEVPATIVFESKTNAKIKNNDVAPATSVNVENSSTSVEEEEEEKDKKVPFESPATTTITNAPTSNDELIDPFDAFFAANNNINNYKNDNNNSNKQKVDVFDEGHQAAVSPLFPSPSYSETAQPLLTSSDPSLDNTSFTPSANAHNPFVEMAASMKHLAAECPRTTETLSELKTALDAMSPLLPVAVTVSTKMELMLCSSNPSGNNGISKMKSTLLPGGVGVRHMSTIGNNNSNSYCNGGTAAAAYDELLSRENKPDADVDIHITIQGPIRFHSHSAALTAVNTSLGRILPFLPTLAKAEDFIIEDFICNAPNGVKRRIASVAIVDVDITPQQHVSLPSSPTLIGESITVDTLSTSEQQEIIQKVIRFINTMIMGGTDSLGKGREGGGGHHAHLQSIALGGSAGEQDGGGAFDDHDDTEEGKRLYNSFNAFPSTTSVLFTNRSPNGSFAGEGGAGGSSNLRPCAEIEFSRCVFSPLQLQDSFDWPKSGELQSISFNNCPLSDPHVTSLVRLARRYELLFLNLRVLRIPRGNISPSVMQALLRFFDEEIENPRLCEIEVPAALIQVVMRNPLTQRLPRLLVNGKTAPK